MSEKQSRQRLFNKQKSCLRIGGVNKRKRERNDTFVFLISKRLTSTQQTIRVASTNRANKYRRTYNKLVFLMGDIKSGRKMNFSFLCFFFSRIQCSLASLNHENWYFIHDCVSGSELNVCYFKLNIPNVMIYLQINQTTKWKKCELFWSLSFSLTRERDTILRMDMFILLSKTGENKISRDVAAG